MIDEMRNASVPNMLYAMLKIPSTFDLIATRESRHFTLMGIDNCTSTHKYCAVFWSFRVDPDLR